MNKKLKIGVILVLVATMLLSAGMVFAGGGKESDGGEKKVEKKKIGVSLFYRRDEFYKDLETGFYEGAEKYGFELNMQDADADAGKQMKQLEDFIASGVDAIAFACADPEGLIPAVQEANKAGIPVFTFDGGVNGGDVVTHVGMDNVLSGEQAGEWAKKYIEKELGGTGNVVILDFPQSAVVCGNRVKGFRSVLDPVSGIEIVAQQDGKASRTESMSVMENILTANPKIDVVFGINDDTIFGGVAAAEAAGRDNIAFISVGWSKELFEKLASNDKYVKASSVQNPYVMGINTMDAINRYFEGESLPPEILQDPIMTTGANVDTLGWEAIVEKRK
jgi:ribose transport system substrate-binding protein